MDSTVKMLKVWHYAKQTTTLIPERPLMDKVVTINCMMFAALTAEPLFLTLFLTLLLNSNWEILHVQQKVP